MKRKLYWFSVEKEFAKVYKFLNENNIDFSVSRGVPSYAGHTNFIITIFSKEDAKVVKSKLKVPVSGL